MSQIKLTDIAVPTTTPSAGTHSIYTKGGGPGVEGLYIKNSAGVEVGPFVSVGGSLDLQTAYENGNTIAVSSAEGPLTLSTSEVVSNLVVTRNTVGAGNAISVVLEATASGSGVVSQTSGVGSAFIGTSLGTGPSFHSQVNNARAYYAKVEGSGATARGLFIQLSNGSATGVGVEINMEGGAAIGQVVDMAAPSTGSAVVIRHRNSISPNIYALEILSPVGVQAAFINRDGQVNTTRLGFSTAASPAPTLTILGDPGGANQPLNLRVQGASLSDLGCLTRTQRYVFSTPGNIPEAASYYETSLNVDTVFFLPDCRRYAPGSEIFVVNTTVGVATATIQADGGPDVHRSFVEPGAVTTDQIINPLNQGRRFVTSGSGGWIMIGAF